MVNSSPNSRWLDAHINQFDGVLRENFSKNIEDFTKNVLAYICELTCSSQGVFFVKPERAEYLEAVATYANPKRRKNTIFDMGEGLVGQAASSQKEIYFEDLTNHSCYLEFASLKVKVASLLFLPLVFNEQVYGVLELAYLRNLEDQYRTFLAQISRNVAIIMESITNHTNTEKLLATTRIQKELLNEREEDLKQSLEEITAIHELLQKQNDQITKAYDKLEQSNANILESIRYAKRIQEAIFALRQKTEKVPGVITLWFTN
ncbi:MAG: GAF domain-containing protein, partial [Bacteroidia bacterium]|nr:GAF domain-containing protein [Bacteroidia bacterium]